MSLHIEDGQGYIDRDGQRKNFTVIDHSPKTSIGSLGPIDLADVTRQLSNYRVDLIRKIVDISPFYAPIEFAAFIKRGDVTRLEWHEDMLTDPGMDLETLRRLYVQMTNRIDIEKETY